jgi:hypothetical protein
LNGKNLGDKTPLNRNKNAGKNQLGSQSKSKSKSPLGKQNNTPKVVSLKSSRAGLGSTPNSMVKRTANYIK